MGNTMKTFKEYYYERKKIMGKQANQNERDEQIIYLNEDSRQNIKDQVGVLLAMLDDYKDRVFLPNVVKSRCREWHGELFRIHRAM